MKPSHHAVLAGALASIAFASFAAASDVSAEDRARFDLACADMGYDAPSCACHGDFFERELSGREFAGAMAVLSDPDIERDPMAAFPKLSALGYSAAEIAQTLMRIPALSEALGDACPAPTTAASPPDADTDEANAPAAHADGGAPNGGG